MEKRVSTKFYKPLSEIPPNLTDGFTEGISARKNIMLFGVVEKTQMRAP